jgi:uncharacterized membrane protein
MKTEVKRGRPKDARVAARDEEVRRLIRAAGRGLSRNEIRDTLDSTNSLIWLSLDRLRRRGLVERCLADGEMVWCLRP